MAKAVNIVELLLPERLTQDFEEQTNIAKKYFEADKLNPEYAGIYLPNVLHRNIQKRLISSFRIIYSHR